MSRFTPFILLLVGAIAVAAGCQKGDKNHSDKKSADVKAGDTLWHRLGGETAVRAVVHDFVGRGAANPKVNFTRKGHPNEWEVTEQSVARLEQRLVEFIGMATGGPQKYTGRDMATSHAGMRITNAEFDALAGDLKATLDEFKVPQKEQDELLQIVGGTRKDIVGK